MGTRWSVRAALPDGRDADAFGAAIVARLDGIVAEMSHWAPESLLSRFNRAAADSWTTLPPDFAQVIAQGLAIAERDQAARSIRRSGGWSTCTASARSPVDRAPDADAIDAALRRSGWRQLIFTPADRRLRQPGGLSLDLSGIAKGHAVDAVADLLGAWASRHALVEIGGELVGRGVRPDRQPWWVDLEAPPGLTLAPLQDRAARPRGGDLGRLSPRRAHDRSAHRLAGHQSASSRPA